MPLDPVKLPRRPRIHLRILPAHRQTHRVPLADITPNHLLVRNNLVHFKSASTRSQRSGSMSFLLTFLLTLGRSGGGASSCARYARARGRFCGGVEGGAGWNMRDARNPRGVWESGRRRRQAWLSLGLWRAGGRRAAGVVDLQASADAALLWFVQLLT